MAAAAAELGVPEMTPVEALMFRPAGSAGLTVHEPAGLPAFVGVSVGMAVDATTDSVVGEYEMFGADSVHTTDVVADNWLEVSVTLSVPAVWEV